MPDLVNNFTTIDPVTGIATGVFPGGVQINASQLSNPPGTTAVRWVRASDGALVADIAGVRPDARIDRLLLRAHSQPSNIITEIVLDSAESPTLQTISLDAGALTDVLLLNNSGQSAFFRGAGGQAQVGNFTATFPGASATVDFVVTHNFNITGVMGLAMGRTGGTLATFCTGEIVATAANTATFRVRTIDATLPAVGTTKTMCFLLWAP